MIKYRKVSYDEVCEDDSTQSCRHFDQKVSDFTYYVHGAYWLLIAANAFFLIP